MGSSSSHPVPGENSEQYNTFFNEKFKIKVCLSICLLMFTLVDLNFNNGRTLVLQKIKDIVSLLQSLF